MTGRLRGLAVAVALLALCALALSAWATAAAYFRLVIMQCYSVYGDVRDNPAPDKREIEGTVR